MVEKESSIRENMKKKVRICKESLLFARNVIIFAGFLLLFLLFCGTFLLILRDFVGAPMWLSAVFRPKRGVGRSRSACRGPSRRDDCCDRAAAILLESQPGGTNETPPGSAISVYRQKPVRKPVRLGG